MSVDKLAIGMSDNVGTKILGAIDRAINGTKPAPKQNPIEAAALVICNLAGPKVKSALGSEWDTAKKCHENQKRFVRLLNFDLTESAGTRAHARQIEEHEKFIAEGGDPVTIERGRSREAWLADIESRRLAVTEASQKNYQIFKPLQAKITAVILEVFLSECADLMLAESKLGAKYGIPYAECPTLKTLRGVQNYLQGSGAGIVLETF